MYPLQEYEITDILVFFACCNFMKFWHNRNGYDPIGFTLEP